MLLAIPNIQLWGLARETRCGVAVVKREGYRKTRLATAPPTEVQTVVIESPTSGRFALIGK
jgi:hypothetical protein